MVNTHTLPAIIIFWFGGNIDVTVEGNSRRK